jgi:hypothetical protein
MEPKHSIPYSLEPTTDPYPKPDEASTYYLFYFSKINFIMFSHLCLVCPSDLFPCIPPNSYCATCPAHHIVLDCSIVITLGEVHRC